MSSTPIYDELAATYLADTDLGRPASPEPGAAAEPPPAEPRSRERTNA
ncbi:hypothetical protein [Saccharothrix algeriensis]|uniref:Uncharacterized protein n=1 Tax=Saccharothrix algeriensis TaxID=173560 RepID=A0A8T8I0X5_9PSEU|nr:hypothetical protein [Saccharothrix algeriensis]MBM7810109.1 hypothetical protein [Saccharothrix algeriensis]QTR04319.1 hypothetical protein J7S33_05160 [Saccharothrix algeriensis]